MNKILKLKKAKNKVNIKLFLLAVGLKEDPTYSLNNAEKETNQVFIFKNKEALCCFLIDRDIDTASPVIQDIINHDLIMKEFDDGTIICSKYLCKYLCDKASEQTAIIQEKSAKKKNKIKARIANKNQKYN